MQKYKKIFYKFFSQCNPLHCSRTALRTDRPQQSIDLERVTTEKRGPVVNTTISA